MLWSKSELQIDTNWRRVKSSSWISKARNKTASFRSSRGWKVNHCQTGKDFDSLPSGMFRNFSVHNVSIPIDQNNSWRWVQWQREAYVQASSQLQRGAISCQHHQGNAIPNHSIWIWNSGKRSIKIYKGCKRYEKAIMKLLLPLFVFHLQTFWFKSIC